MFDNCQIKIYAMLTVGKDEADFVVVFTEGAGSDAVQQSQVSSSKPSILASDVLGPLLLEVRVCVYVCVCVCVFITHSELETNFR